MLCRHKELEKEAMEQLRLQDDAGEEIQDMTLDYGSRSPLHA